MNARPLPDHPLQYRAALQGREPADALTTRDRHRLVALFIDAGMTDVEIADRTRMTTYTTARIRRDIFLRRLDEPWWFTAPTNRRSEVRVA